MPASGQTMKRHRLPQCIAPNVLGRISPTNRMATVSAADTTGTRPAPRTLVAYIPQTVAPAVLATVLSTRIADVGCAMLVFIAMKRSATRACLPSDLAASRVLSRVE